MKVAIEVSIENAAFWDDDGQLDAGELIRVIADAADYVANASSGDSGPLHDRNGDTVGQWEVKP